MLLGSSFRRDRSNNPWCGDNPDRVLCFYTDILFEYSRVTGNDVDFYDIGIGQDRHRMLCLIATGSGTDPECYVSPT